MHNHIKKLIDSDTKKGDIIGKFNDTSGNTYQKSCIGFVVGRTATNPKDLEVLHEKRLSKAPYKRTIVYDTREQAARACTKLGFEYVRPYFYSQIVK